ncbi:MAG TPA: efflux RND transporter periplasmic adaptor subunit, partial [Patescibacteria group bacterium]|nr:efflux RND transporter periplasmic adaptor subunit [Patescibacteria group bacterium]
SLTTGALRIAALFPNANYALRPGQFGRVRVQFNLANGALLVPQKAVSELQGSYQVALVDSQNTVHVQPVRVGERIGTKWIIEEGLHPGERVIVEGIQKVREGTIVNATNAPPEPAAPVISSSPGK